MEKRSISSYVYRLLSQKEEKCDESEKGRQDETLHGEHAGSEREEDSDADDENAKTRTNQTASEWKSAFNIMNFMAGSGFMAIPYAVKVGGISALVSLLVMPFILWYTGTILIDCLYSEDRLHGHKIRVYSTYREISEACLPGVGGILLDIFVFAGLFFVTVGYFVMCGSLLSHALPFVPLSQTTWVVITGAVVLPTIFLAKLGEIAWFSVVGMAAVLGIVATVVSYGSSRISAVLPNWQSTELLFWDTEAAAIALGIFLFSYASHIVLIDTEEGMIDRKKFKRALGWSYAIMAVVKLVFVVIAFLAFGQNTQEVILNNLPRGPIRIIVSALYMITLIFTFALPLYAFVRNLEHISAVENLMSKLPRAVWFIGIRVSLFLLVLLTSILLPHFAALLAFVGSCVTPMMCMTLPCTFHLKLKYKELSVCKIITDIIVAVVGLFLWITLLYFSIRNLVMLKDD